MGTRPWPRDKFTVPVPDAPRTPWFAMTWRVPGVGPAFATHGVSSILHTVGPAAISDFGPGLAPQAPFR
jgi:hypothetical protein